MIVNSFLALSLLAIVRLASTSPLEKRTTIYNGHVSQITLVRATVVLILVIIGKGIPSTWQRQRSVRGFPRIGF